MLMPPCFHILFYGSHLLSSLSVYHYLYHKQITMVVLAPWELLMQDSALKVSMLTIGQSYLKNCCLNLTDPILYLQKSHFKNSNNFTL